MSSARPPVHSLAVYADSKCAHYHSELDIVALRHPCCGKFYACVACHDALESHRAAPWPRSRWGEPAVCCGACGTVITVLAYMDRYAQNEAAVTCPACSSGWNPKCKRHWTRYFDMGTAESEAEPRRR